MFPSFSIRNKNSENIFAEKINGSLIYSPYPVDLGQEKLQTQSENENIHT